VFVFRDCDVDRRARRDYLPLVFYSSRALLAYYFSFSASFSSLAVIIKAKISSSVNMSSL